MSMGMSTRSSRSSVASEEAPSSSAATSTPRNLHVGTSGGGSAPHVSLQGADPLQGLKIYIYIYYIYYIYICLSEIMGWLVGNKIPLLMHTNIY